MTADSLSSKLSSYDYSATTEGGYQWLRKALHPADETIKSPRMPCHGVHPTATQECVMTFVLSAPSGGDGTWSARLALKNDPLCPLDILTVQDGDDLVSKRYTVINQCYCSAAAKPFDEHTPAQYDYMLTRFRESCEAYRTTALSVTGYFVGASLTDQGSIVSAQTSDSHQDFTLWANLDNDHPIAMPRAWCACQAIPTVDTMLMGTNAYLSPAREGFYVPYKLGSVGKWFSTDNIAYCFRFNNTLDQRRDLTSLTNEQMYPHGYQAPLNEPWLPPIDDNISVTHIRNVASTTSFRITVRIAIEVMTRPDSNLAAFAELPALPDDHALHMYDEIASRLKDAYPGRDNANGTLWRKIKDIAGGLWDTVSPALSAAGLGPIVAAGNAVKTLWGPAENALLGIAGKAKAARRQAQKSQKPASPIEKQQAQLASSAASKAERASAEPAEQMRPLKNTRLKMARPVRPPWQKKKKSRK